MNPKDFKEELFTLYRQGMSIIELSRYFDKPYPSLTYWLKKEGLLTTKRPSQGNVNYFEHIDTHTKAYFLGFIAADGCIYIDKDKDLYRFSLTMNTKDIALMYKFKEEVSFDTKILNTTPYDKRTDKFYNRTQLTLGNQTFCKHLVNKGIYPNKTYTLSNIFPNIPKEFRDSFILGYFDGDGHVAASVDKRVPNPNYRTYSIQVCGTTRFLQAMKEELELYRASIYESKNFSTLNICNKDEFFRFYQCYNNLEFYLERKHSVFLQRINQAQTISSPTPS